MSWLKWIFNVWNVCQIYFYRKKKTVFYPHFVIQLVEKKTHEMYVCNVIIWISSTHTQQTVNYFLIPKFGQRFVMEYTIPRLMPKLEQVAACDTNEIYFVFCLFVFGMLNNYRDCYRNVFKWGQEIVVYFHQINVHSTVRQNKCLHHRFKENWTRSRTAFSIFFFFFRKWHFILHIDWQKQGFLRPNISIGRIFCMQITPIIFHLAIILITPIIFQFFFQILQKATQFIWCRSVI